MKSTFAALLVTTVVCVINSAPHSRLSRSPVEEATGAGPQVPLAVPRIKQSYISVDFTRPFRGPSDSPIIQAFTFVSNRGKGTYNAPTQRDPVAKYQDPPVEVPTPSTTYTETTTDAPAPTTYKETTETDNPTTPTYVKPETVPVPVTYEETTETETSTVPNIDENEIKTESPESVTSYSEASSVEITTQALSAEIVTEAPAGPAHQYETPKPEIQSVYFPVIYDAPKAEATAQVENEAENKVEVQTHQNQIDEGEVPATVDESSSAQIVPEVSVEVVAESSSSADSSSYSAGSEVSVEIPAKVEVKYPAAESSSSTNAETVPQVPVEIPAKYPTAEPSSSANAETVPQVPVEIPEKVKVKYPTVGSSSSDNSGYSKTPAVYKKPFTYFHKRPYVNRFASGNGYTGIFAENSWTLKTKDDIPAAAVAEALADINDANKRATEVKVTEEKAEPVVASTTAAVSTPVVNAPLVDVAVSNDAGSTVSASAAASTSSTDGQSVSASASAASESGGAPVAEPVAVVIAETANPEAVSVATVQPVVVEINTPVAAPSNEDGPDAATIIASAINEADTDPVEIKTTKDGHLEADEVESAVADAADVDKDQVGPVDVVEVIDLTGVAPEDIPADVQVFEIVDLQGVPRDQIPADVIPVELFPVEISGTVPTGGSSISAASQSVGVPVASPAAVSVEGPAKTEIIPVATAQPVIVETQSGTETAGVKIEPVVVSAPTQVVVPVINTPIAAPSNDDGPDAATIIASAIDEADTDPVEIETTKDGHLEADEVESAVADAADVDRDEVGPVDVVEVIDLTGVAPEDIPADVQVFEIVDLRGIPQDQIPADVIPVELFPVDVSGTVAAGDGSTVSASAVASTSSADQSVSATAFVASETVPGAPLAEPVKTEVTPPAQPLVVETPLSVSKSHKSNKSSKCENESSHEEK